ncbi:MAG: AI-2E family transporter, partial [Ginsengibacter sp.]
MEKKYPFYFRATVTLFCIMLFVYVLFMLKAILIPIAFAIMVAILLNPFVNKLQGKKIPRILAICIALLTALLLVAGIMVFISSQVLKFSDNLPVLEQRFSQLFSNFQFWLQDNYSLSL